MIRLPNHARGGTRAKPDIVEGTTLEKRRVVITGMGAVTPLGNTRDEFWRRLIAGESGVARVTAFDAAAAGLKAQIAAEVKNFDPDALIGRRDARRMDRYAQFAFVAANEAIEDANFPADRTLRDETGVVVASGIGGIITIQDNVTKARAAGSAGRITPFFIPMLMSNAAPAQISMRHGFRGPMYAVSSACASSNDALGVAYDLIVHGKVRAMISGGSEATITDVAMGGFDSMKALSTRNDDPTRASRPFDAQRDGFVLAEGGAIFVLEELSLARSRGARIYAELLGYGQSGCGRSGRRRRGARAAALVRVCRYLAGRHRLRQRSCDLDPDRRSRGVSGAGPRDRRQRAQIRGQFDQEHARARARSGGCPRRRRDRARDRKFDHSADDQLRVSRSAMHARLRSERRSQGRSQYRAFEFVRLRRPQQRRRVRQVRGLSDVGG
jgi:3-oxoacyl-(acyl-carrier-protein) synthase